MGLPFWMPALPITFPCPHCSRTLRVADSFAGRRGTCPACQSALQIPAGTESADRPEPEGAGPYELLEDPDAGRPAALRPAPERGPGSSSAGSDPRRASGDDGRSIHDAPADAELAARRRAAARPPRPEPWWTRDLIVIAGVGITPRRLLVIPLVVLPLLVWWVTGPGRVIKVESAAPVHAVHLLNSVGVLPPPASGVAGIAGALAGGGGSSSWPTTFPPAGSTAAVSSPGSPMVLTVDGTDDLIVTRPESDGEWVLVRVAIQQRLLNNLGLTSRGITELRGDEFTLRKSGLPTNSPDAVSARIAAAVFPGGVDVELMGSATSDYLRLLPPDAPTRADRFEVERLPGRFAGQAEYVLGNTKGSVAFSAGRASADAPASPGLSATGRLTIDAPDNGPEVVADYRGAALRVDWDAESRGHYATDRYRVAERASPWSRHEFALLFPRPVDGGRFTLALSGRDLTSVKLSRTKQPSAPTPSPIASNRPGGPAPASKTSGSPLAYFDVIRDARGQAQGLVSANNMRQIGFALQSYLNDHRGQFPDSLLDLRGYAPIEQLVQNPRTGENPGFIYEKPPAGANPGTTPVLFEAFNGQKDPNGAILYADGNIR